MNPSSLRRPHILIVDDLVSNIRVLSEALIADYTIRFATSGAECLATLETSAPDLVLLDIMMPEMDGHEVLRRIRTTAAISHIPVIFVTADSSLESELQGLTQGADDYLTKPVAVPILQARVRNLLERQRLRHHLEELVAQRTAELAASEAQYRGLVEQTIAGILIIQAGRLVYVNPGFALILGRSDAWSSLLGQPVSAWIMEDDRARFARFVAELSADPESSSTAVFLGQRADGRRLDLELHGRAIQYQGQSAIIGLVLDITERRRAEAAQISALTLTEQLAALKNQFMANMSHELRTPLHHVLGLAELGMHESNVDSLHQYFRRILDTGQQLRHLLDGVLDFSAVETGALTIKSAPFRPLKALERALRAPGLLARAKGLEMVIEPAPTLPTLCLGDGPRLEQVLNLLLSNAVKFTERGQVRVQASLEEGRLVFVLTDTGPGMNAEQMEQARRPFMQLESSHSRHYGGIGLGLALSERLVELMGGLLNLRSSPGAGSQVEVRVPCQQLSASEILALPDDPPLNGCRILALGYNPIDRIVVEEILVDEGAEVDWVETTSEIKTLMGLRHERPYQLLLIVVDHQGTDWKDKIQALRLAAQPLPVVGIVDPQWLEHAFLEQPQPLEYYLEKPIDVDALVKMIQRHVHGR